MIRSTTSSEDEDDSINPNHFLTPSSDISFSPNNDVVEINHNDNDLIHIDDLSRLTPIIHHPQYHTYLNLSTSSSETSLARPLLNEKNSITTGILYTDNIKINSSDCLTTNFYPFIKFYFIDMLISAFIITSLVNIYWRGAWDLLDIYLLPKDACISALVSLIIGLFMLYIIYLIQNILQKFYDKYRKNILGQIMTRFYTLITALAYIKSMAWSMEFIRFNK